MMLVALCTATILLCLVTVLPLWKYPHWIIRGCDFPRLQFFIFATLILLLEIVLFDKDSLVYGAFLLLTAACLVWQLWWILPYTRLWPAEVKSGPGGEGHGELSIITANVLMHNRSADTLIQHVREHQPDILVTLESDLWWQKRLDALLDVMPYAVKCPLDNLYGMHVYSRMPLLNEEIAYLVEADVPSIHASVRLENGAEVQLHFLHPAPPSPTENVSSIERDAELIVVALSLKNRQIPIIVTGDLNDVAWSATTHLFRKLSGLLDPRIGRGMFNTFHAKFWFMRWPLDHLFHSQHFTLRSMQRLSAIGSDHFALLTRLVFTPTLGSDQNGLEETADDRSWGRSIVADGGLDIDSDTVAQPVSNSAD